jgi:hypothetical protein
MKIISPALRLLGFFLGILLCTSACAQDTIVKTNGRIVKAKILEVGPSTVSYKLDGFDEDGPTFTDKKTDIAYIKFKNGQRQDITIPSAPAIPANAGSGTTESPVSGKTTLQATPAVPVTPGITTSGNGPAGSTGSKNKIERINKKFTINGIKTKSKEVDRLMNKSQNPAVQIACKSAHAMKVAQKIVGYTSIGTNLGGGYACIATFQEMYNLMQTGKATQQSYINAGASFLGTLTFPITNKILKKKTGKLRDKAIDLYNLTN